MLRRKYIGIDLGTTVTYICHLNSGIVMDEPTLVALDKETKGIIAVGKEAAIMQERHPGNIEICYPFKGGVIADFEITSKMIRILLLKSLKNKKTILKPKVVVAIPSGITSLEEKYLKDAVLKAGAGSVYFMPELLAAASGVGLAVSLPKGNMILDIGGGASEAAIISLGAVANSCSTRTAGNRMDRDIMEYVKNKYDIIIGKPTAGKIKLELAFACFENKEEAESCFSFSGKNQISGLPVSSEIRAWEVLEALAESIGQIYEVVKRCLETAEPELVADVIKEGFLITGGGSCIKHLDLYLSQKTGVPVRQAQEPLHAVIQGIEKSLQNVAKRRNLI